MQVMWFSFAVCSAAVVTLAGTGIFSFSFLIADVLRPLFHINTLRYAQSDQLLLDFVGILYRTFNRRSTLHEGWIFGGDRPRNFTCNTILMHMWIIRARIFRISTKT
jgi:hypothetical protein